MQYYIRRCRAQEELALVKEEMINTLKYWDKQESIILEAFNFCSGGVKILLCERHQRVLNFIAHLKAMFSPTIPIQINEEERRECESFDDWDASDVDSLSDECSDDSDIDNDSDHELYI